MPDHRKSSHNSGPFSLSSVGGQKKKNVPSSNCISMKVQPARRPAQRRIEERTTSEAAAMGSGNLVRMNTGVDPEA